jgi:hypothetical protein
MWLIIWWTAKQASRRTGTNTTFCQSEFVHSSIQDSLVLDIQLFCHSYEVLVCGDVERLIKKRQNSNNAILYYVSIEETFDVIAKAGEASKQQIR